MILNETKQKFVELRAGGMSFSKISSELNISKPTLISWSQDLKDLISNMETLERDALYEKYRMDKANRINIFSEELTRIRIEFQKRDLTTIPTDKLLSILIQLQNSLDKEVAPIVFRGKKDIVNFDIVPDESWTA